MFSGIDRAANHAQRRAVISGRGQRAGVAMRQHCRAIGDQLAAKFSQGTIRCNVFVEDRQRFADQALLNLFNVFGFAFGFQKRAAHALDRPKQIHGRGPRRFHDLAHIFEIVFQIGYGRSHRLTGSEGEAHRCRDANRRRSAHNHFLDRVGDFFVRTQH